MGGGGGLALGIRMRCRLPPNGSSDGSMSGCTTGVAKGWIWADVMPTNIVVDVVICLADGTKANVPGPHRQIKDLRLDHNGDGLRPGTEDAQFEMLGVQMEESRNGIQKFIDADAPAHKAKEC